MSKTSMLFAGAVGYVLGARAGRERYEQIMNQAQRIWTNPNVQKASRNAQDLAREKAPIVGEKLSGAAKSAAASASGAVSGHNGDEGGNGAGDTEGLGTSIVADVPVSSDGPLVT
jgi:SLT domain-containing protein